MEMHDTILAPFIGTLGDICKFFKKSLSPLLHALIRVFLFSLGERPIHPVCNFQIAQAIYEIQPEHNPQL